MISLLPETIEGERYGHMAWSVGGKVFAWERPFSKADVRRFGNESVPQGPIIAVGVLDLDDKAAVLEAIHKGVFTIEHFNNYPAILVQLDVAAKRTVKTLLTDGWMACAAARLTSR